MNEFVIFVLILGGTHKFMKPDHLAKLKHLNRMDENYNDFVSLYAEPGALECIWAIYDVFKVYTVPKEEELQE